MEPNKSQIPSLKDTKKPELRVKGMAVGMSLVDRVKSFRKKDLAFIGAGLAVLFLAPLVEHFLMAPDGGQTGAFKEGWTFRGDAASGGGSFGKGGSPYEPGVTGLAPGGLLGSGSEIITPLNVRDPASLVMGPGQSSAQPVTAAAAPASASAAKPASDWKDALAAAAGRGAGAAAKAASLPVPKVPLQGGLRGLGVLGGGGSGASWTGGGVGPAAGSSKPAGSNSLTNVKAAPGFQGVAGKRGNSATGSMEDLKKAGEKAAEGYNRGGGAGNNLLTSADASQAIPGGGSAGGAGGSAGDGKEDKAGGANKDMRSNARGEQSLAYQIAKENAMRQLDLDWEKKKKNEMFWPDLKRDMQKELAMAPVKGLSEAISGMMKDSLGFLTDRDKGSVSCVVGGTAKNVGAVGKCGSGGKNAGDSGGYCTASPGGKCKAEYGVCLYAKKDQPITQESPIAGTNCGGSVDNGKPGAGETGGPTELPASAEQQIEPGQKPGPDGKPLGDGLMKQCQNMAAESKKEIEAMKNDKGGFNTQMLKPVKHLVTAYSYLYDLKYSDAGPDVCKRDSLKEAPTKGNTGDQEMAVKDIQKDAVVELDKVNKKVSEELSAVHNQMMPCISPTFKSKESACETIAASIKAVNDDLVDGKSPGSKCTCTEVSCEDNCGKRANKVIAGLDNNGEYFKDAVTKANSALKKFLEESKARQEDSKTSLEKVSKGENGSAAGLMPNAKKQLGLVDAKIKEAEDLFDAELKKADCSQISVEECRELKGKINSYKDTLVKGTRDEYGKRVKNQTALADGYKNTKAAWDVVLPVAEADRASKFVDWSVKGGPASKTGYSKNFQSGEATNLPDVPAAAKLSMTPRFAGARGVADTQMDEAKTDDGNAKKAAAATADSTGAKKFQGKTEAEWQQAAALARDTAVKAWKKAFEDGKTEDFAPIAPPKPAKTAAYPSSQFEEINKNIDASNTELKKVK